MNTLTEVKNKLQNGMDLTIDFVGDSITEGLSHCLPEETYVAKFAAEMSRRYPAYTVQRYDGIVTGEFDPISGFDGPVLVSLGNGEGTLDVIRNGVGGNTVTRAHNRIENFTGTLANGKRPDVTFFMFGINDALKSDPKKYVTADVFKENYRNLIHAVKKENPDTAIVLMIATYNDQSIEEHCQKTLELAKEEGLPYIDLHRLWMDHYDEKAEHFGQGNWLVGGFDACHPTPLAAEITAKAVVDGFLDLLNEE